MAYETYNEEHLQHLERLAKSGDETAYNLLLSEGKRVAKAANSRLLRLEKAGLQDNSYAYSYAEFFTSYDNKAKNRFRVNKSQSVEDLADNLRAMRHFMSQESSTVKGYRYAEKRFYDTISAYGIEVPEGDRGEFFAFIRSDSVQDAIDYIGSYDIIMDIIANNIDEIHNSFSNLLRQFNEGLANRDTYDEFINRASGGNYETLYKRHMERVDSIRNRNRSVRKHFKK